MSPQNLSAASRTRLILEDLEAVRENLLAFSDDIWLSIDHNDDTALEDGVTFKRAYNQKVAAFDSVASELSQLVQQYTAVNLESEEKSGADDHESNSRIIAELDRDIPHSLDEDFTFKRPFAFVLEGRATTGVTTWQRLKDLRSAFSAMKGFSASSLWRMRAFCLAYQDLAQPVREFNESPFNDRHPRSDFVTIRFG